MSLTRLNCKGLSLVEVVLSALLLGVVLGALYATYINASNLMSLARNKIIALNWAESIIENHKDGVTTNDPEANNMLEQEKSGVSTIVDVSLGALWPRYVRVDISWTE